MKKKGRGLALFLAIALVFSGVSFEWDNGIVANADTGTDTETNAGEAAAETNPYEKMNFDNMDVSTLTEKGFTSTKFSNATGTYQPVEGEIDQPVSAHWFSGDGTDTPYYKNGTLVSGILSKNIGLKPRTNTDTNRYYLNTP